MATQNKAPTPITLPTPWLMLTGGTAASIAETLTIPFDTGKVRLQIQGDSGANAKYQGMIHCLKTVAAEEGILALWSGLGAGIQRQYVFASLRLGMYEPVRDWIAAGKEATLGQRILTGLITGTLAMLVASPTDLVKVRMQAQGKWKLIDPSKVKYSGVFNAYSKIYAEEGFLAFWTGVGPNCVRNAVINAAELATQDQAKTMLLKSGLMKDNIWCQFVSSAIAGGVACLVGSPVDVVKTRIMNQDPKSPTAYKGVIDCILRTAREEGFFAFYKGIQANATRIISWNIAMFVTWGEIKKIVHKKYFSQH